MGILPILLDVPFLTTMPFSKQANMFPHLFLLVVASSISQVLNQKCEILLPIPNFVNFPFFFFYAFKLFKTTEHELHCCKEKLVGLNLIKPKWSLVSNANSGGRCLRCRWGSICHYLNLRRAGLSNEGYSLGEERFTLTGFRDPAMLPDRFYRTMSI